MQEQQEQRLKQFMEGKEALFSQSHYIQFTCDMRRYHLKKAVDSSKAKCLTLDKLMDINEKFSTRDLQLSLNVKPQDVRKMVTRIMSRPFHSTSTTSAPNPGWRSTGAVTDRNQVMPRDDRLLARPQQPKRACKL